MGARQRVSGLNIPQQASPAERSRQIIARLRSDIEDAIGCRVLVEKGNTPEAVGAFKDGEGHVPVLIRASLLQSLLLTMTRMHDSHQPDLDCLETLKRLLTLEVKAAITAPYGDEAMERATLLWRSLRGDGRIVRLREYRSKALVHTIMSKWPELDRPVYDDLMGLARDTETLIEALATGTGICTVELASVEDIWRRRAADYWRRLVATSPGGPAV